MENKPCVGLLAAKPSHAPPQTNLQVRKVGGGFSSGNRRKARCCGYGLGQERASGTGMVSSQINKSDADSAARRYAQFIGFRITHNENSSVPVQPAEALAGTTRTVPKGTVISNLNVRVKTRTCPTVQSRHRHHTTTTNQFAPLQRLDTPIHRSAPRIP